MGALGPLRGSPIVARRSAPDPLGVARSRFATSEGVLSLESYGEVPLLSRGDRQPYRTNDFRDSRGSMLRVHRELRGLLAWTLRNHRLFASSSSPVRSRVHRWVKSLPPFKSCSSDGRLGVGGSPELTDPAEFETLVPMPVAFRSICDHQCRDRDASTLRGSAFVRQLNPRRRTRYLADQILAFGMPIFSRLACLLNESQLAGCRAVTAGASSRVGQWRFLNRFHPRVLRDSTPNQSLERTRWARSVRFAGRHRGAPLSSRSVRRPSVQPRLPDVASVAICSLALGQLHR